MPTFAEINRKHKRRHDRLHRALEELVLDFFNSRADNDLGLLCSLHQFFLWSKDQSELPDNKWEDHQMPENYYKEREQ